MKHSVRANAIFSTGDSLFEKIILDLDNSFQSKIIALLEKEGRLNVTEIYERLGWIQTVASFHLNILRKAGILKVEQEGRNMEYSLNYARIEAIASDINEFNISALQKIEQA